MAITSQVRPAAAHEALVQDWRAAGLLKSSVMKPVIATINTEIKALKSEMNGASAIGKAW